MNSTSVYHVLTPNGRGAVATIGICCDEATANQLSHTYFQAASGKSLPQFSLGRLHFGRWDNEEVVVARCSQTTYEISCHGGPVAIQRLSQQLEKAGLKPCHAEDWLARHQSLLIAQWQPLISGASTERLALLCHDHQARGEAAFRRWLGWIEQIEQRPDSLKTILAELEQALECRDSVRYLSSPPTLVIAGRPNVGKSSLMNRLLGYERVIVYDQPGTTRDAIQAQTAIEGWPLELMDTAGLRETTDHLEQQGIELSKSFLQQADFQILLFDLSQPPTAEDEQLLKQQSASSLIVGNKADCENQWGDRFPKQGIAISCETGEGIERLLSEIARLIAIPTPAAPVPMPATAVMSEALEQLNEFLKGSQWENAAMLLQRWLAEAKA